MKLAVVVQRYGADINGGAELHARYIAERLSRHVDVHVLTSCARDYITWRNELAPGDDVVNGVPVRRFPVRRERDPDDFGRRSHQVFEKRHSIRDELDWLDSEGPTSPALLAHLHRAAATYDFIVFFSYRYHHAYHGVRAAPSRAVLVPTAERDPALGLATAARTFRNVRALMYNSHEERALIQGVSDNRHVPGVIVGVGSDVREDATAARFRARSGIKGPFALYVGRIDENKGCTELFDYFSRYAGQVSQRLQLLLVGKPVMAVPSHERIRHLGFLSDEEKYDALAAADALLMPSYYESLSMVTLEAWAMRIPVLANGRCDVLRGQVIRANAGLYYESYDEFAEALHLLETNRGLRRALGANGRAYFERHYTWDVVENKYLAMLERLARADEDGCRARREPEPGWLRRRRRVLPPAREVVDTLPAGPAAATWEAGADSVPDGGAPRADER
ncbi:MAG: glycosyltransferase [Acidobacteria bacterium]|nr:glycosyltransferase [Acidobacteriota bacterium]